MHAWSHIFTNLEPGLHWEVQSLPVVNHVHRVKEKSRSPTWCVEASPHGFRGGCTVCSPTSSVRGCLFFRPSPARAVR